MGERYCLYMHELSKEKPPPGQKKNYPAAGYGTPMFLFRMLRANDPVPFRRWRIILQYTVKALFMMPSSLFEKIFLSKKIWSTPIPKTPVFILGHYRSGTTFLHKVLSADRQWTHLTTFDFLFPYLPKLLEKPVKFLLNLFIRIFQIQHPHFNNYRVKLEDPLEEDMITISSLTPQSAFWGEVFPRKAKEYFSRQMFFPNDHDKEAWKQGYHYLLKKFTRRKPGRFLLKNPPNTGRIRALLELFPDAKFIFIYRNPYQVFYSTRSLWRRTLEKHYTLQRITDKEREELIFWHYEQMMEIYQRDRSLIPPGNLAEVRYETFEQDPFSEAERIYRELGLPGFDLASRAIREQVEKERSYRKYRYTYDHGEQVRVEKRWGAFIRKWNYEKLK